jgi:Tol biopolymer transport system component
MALTTGTTLGAYEITAPLGAGGMGEVYRARDTKLGRDVAIKILPDAFAADPERVARFQREAQILASLNHPHIAAIYGLEESGATRFLVLEFVDGESLAQKLQAPAASHQSPGLSVGEALAIARQIIDALEAAHDKGIVHRDLKPANIMLTAEGQVKVLDFGLAKQGVGPGESAGPGGATHSPTLTFAATQAGMILGTAAYMSPEQARGRAADKRSDVWAFGCVLYEMLTGARAFDGEDATEIIAAVVKTEPDWNAFPADVPAHIRAIVKRCLAKDRKARIPDLSVVRFMLDEPAPAPGDAGSERTRPTYHVRRLRIWQAATALLLLTTTAVPVTYLLRTSAPVVTRFIVSPPENATFVIFGRSAAEAAISPDGTRLAFTARDAAGKIQLWVRPIDSLTAQPLVGTDNAAYPFWSPDSRFLGYSTTGKLMKIAAAGGPPQTLCALSATNMVGRGGAWNRDGVIVFNSGPGTLFRVSSAGGQQSPVGRLAPGQAAHTFPSFLPDGHHVLYHGSASTQELSGLYVMSLDTGESKRLLDADTGGIYAAQGGYLLFVRQGTLLAQTFDPKTLALANEPFPVAERVEFGVVPGLVAFSLSENGTLGYGIGSAAAAGLQMVWLDRKGKQSETVGPPGDYRGLDLSPDGKRVAAHRHDGNGGDIWISELSRGTTSRFTFDASQDSSSPVWSPDGSRIAFGSLRNGKSGLYQKLSNGTSPEEQLLESDVTTLPVSWSPDGRSIVYSVVNPKTATDQWMLPLSGDRKPVPLLQTPFQESHGQISPDGKWLAYYSNETGRTEVYVQPFPQGTGKWQVSTNGGQFPRWRHDGRELFYMSQGSRGKMMAVDVKSSGSAFEAGAPKELFDSLYMNLPHGSGGPYSTYAVSPDGQRFLIPRPASNDQSATAAPIVVVLNWLEGLKK